MKKFLCVGINHFMRPGNDLNECVADAETMMTVSHYLGADATVVLKDSQATKANVMSQLTALVEEAKAGSLIYIGFSYSAHGTHYPRPSEPDGVGEALVCYDIAEKDGGWDQATIIKDTELHDLLNSVPPTCLVEVWLDTCYSGGMDRALNVLGRRSRYLHNPNNQMGQTRVANSSMHTGLNVNVVMWCACSEAQESADAPDLGNGAFTYYWNKCFKAAQASSRVDILVATRASLREGGFDQFPRLKCWNTPAQAPVGVSTQLHRDMTECEFPHGTVS